MYKLLKMAWVIYVYFVWLPSIVIGKVVSWLNELYFKYLSDFY